MYANIDWINNSCNIHSSSSIYPDIYPNADNHPDIYSEIYNSMLSWYLVKQYLSIMQYNYIDNIHVTIYPDICAHNIKTCVHIVTGLSIFDLFTASAIFDQILVHMLIISQIFIHASIFLQIFVSS